jgi:hypothetical protein
MKSNGAAGRASTGARPLPDAMGPECGIALESQQAEPGARIGLGWLSPRVEVTITSA